MRRGLDRCRVVRTRRQADQTLFPTVGPLNRAIASVFAELHFWPSSHIQKTRLSEKRNEGYEHGDYSSNRKLNIFAVFVHCAGIRRQASNEAAARKGSDAAAARARDKILRNQIGACRCGGEMKFSLLLVIVILQWTLVALALYFGSMYSNWREFPLDQLRSSPDAFSYLIDSLHYWWWLSGAAAGVCVNMLIQGAFRVREILIQPLSMKLCWLGFALPLPVLLILGRYLN